MSGEVRERPARGEGTFDDRRDRLAWAALETLGTLGYANTGLRDIAAKSDFSHGVLHYYFKDKVELIIHGVRLYKAVCVTRYDSVVEESQTAAELATNFAGRLAQTLIEDAAMHRLWYDLRAQSLFEPALREDVAMIDLALQQMISRIVLRYVELSGTTLTVSLETAYALVDGMFEQALLRHTAGIDNSRSVAVMQAEVPQVLANLVN